MQYGDANLFALLRLESLLQRLVVFVGVVISGIGILAEQGDTVFCQSGAL